MKCPKCGKSSLMTPGLLVESQWWCPSCRTYYNKWQQSEIDRLKAEVERWKWIADERNVLNMEKTIAELQEQVKRLQAGLREIAELDAIHFFDVFALQQQYRKLAQRCLDGKGGLEWQTGKPPCDGWYWVTGYINGKPADDYDPDIVHLELYYNDHAMYSKWAGPIPEPAGKGE